MTIGYITTPQPWMAHHDEGALGDDRGWSVIDANGIVILSGLAEADARLIAAAPELLEACQEAIRRWGGDTGNDHTCASIRAAIAKATEGEAE